jgi:phosphatidylglycerol lysyltransferase
MYHVRPTVATESAPGGRSDERARARALALRHGFNATTFQTVRAGYRYFFHEDGCVAYVDTGSAWVAAGAPIAPTENLAAAANAFAQAARTRGRRCCFFGVEDRFLKATRLPSIRIGEQPVWDPREWGRTLSAAPRLREQLRRARSKGVRVRLVAPDEMLDGVLRDETVALVERWLETRALPPMGFLVGLGPDTLAADGRWFVAERDGRVVGALRIVPVPRRAGWLVEHIIRAPRAPNGTTETLVDAAMRQLAEEGSPWASLGLAPLAGSVPRLLRLARTGLRALYDFEGLLRFKGKLRPRSWSPIHLAFPATQGPTVTVFDVLAAFARGGLVRFALRAARRVVATVLGATTARLRRLARTN